ncbi:MAG: ABC transporter permease [Deltaproteobacteria bacterium]|nr:MAG: ABC transporter permease [Deltaproteobacteria bacterium]
MYFQLGWRNIWRNPRRTAVIMIAVIIGVWSMIFLGALMRGMIEDMIENGIATLTGHIQVHHKGYRDDPVIENSIADLNTIESALESLLPPGTQWTPRVRVNGIASNARHSDGVTLVGIDPELEAKVSFIGHAVTQGRYLTLDEENGILVGKALIDKFETKLGRKLVLMSQDTSGEIASRSFRIVGVFRAEMEATEKQFAFVTMHAAQRMLRLQGDISEVSIRLKDQGETDRVTNALKETLPSAYEVHSWRDLLPLLSAYMRLFDGFMWLWYLVVFIAMGFGIVNTMLMAVFERIREFGLLKALGMRPWWIIKEVLAESFFLLVIGMAIGNTLGLLSVLALSGSGIDLSALAAGTEYVGMARVIYPAVSGKDVAMANLMVFILGLLVSVYPAAKAARFTPVEALAHT